MTESCGGARVFLPLHVKRCPPADNDGATSRRLRYSRRMIEDQEVVLANLTEELVRRFAPERIVLFGSRARGDHHPDSDYDVIMVLGDVQYPEADVRRIVQQLFFNIEIFVGSRERFE